MTDTVGGLQRSLLISNASGSCLPIDLVEDIHKSIVAPFTAFTQNLCTSQRVSTGLIVFSSGRSHTRSKVFLRSLSMPWCFSKKVAAPSNPMSLLICTYILPFQEFNKGGVDCLGISRL